MDTFAGLISAHRILRTQSESLQVHAGKCLYCRITLHHYSQLHEFMNHDATYHSLPQVQVSDHGEGEDGLKMCRRGQRSPSLKKRFLVVAERGGLLLYGKEQKDATCRDLPWGSGVGRTSQFGLSVYDLIRVAFLRRPSSFLSCSASRS